MIDPTMEQAAQIKRLERQLQETQQALAALPIPLRYSGTAARAFWSIASAGTTDTNGDLVVTATWLSAITGGYGAQPIAANNNRYCTVHTVSGNTFTIRFRSAPTGAVIASTAVDYTAWAIGPPA